MIRKTTLFMAALLLAISVAPCASAEESSRAAVFKNWGYFNWMAGSWYLALDSQPFGLPPGFPLSGLAVFNSDGTFQVLDAGDFGQATFTNTQHSAQYGAWRYTGFNSAVGTTLFLEADLSSGEVLRWNKVEFTLQRSADRDVVEGTVNVSVLECANLLPLPTPLTCPDPTDPANVFTSLPPVDDPVTFKRLRPRF